MSRFMFLLATLSFTALVPCLHAQGYQQRNEFAWQDAYVANTFDTTPPAPWVPEHAPSPKYPVLVLLQQQDVHYHWSQSTFTGGGLAHFYAPVGQTVNFKYNCGITFARNYPTEFHARWTKNGTQLQILLQKPGSNRTTTCNVKPSPLPVQQASSSPPAKP